MPEGTACAFVEKYAQVCVSIGTPPPAKKMALMSLKPLIFLFLFFPLALCVLAGVL